MHGFHPSLKDGVPGVTVKALVPVDGPVNGPTLTLDPSYEVVVLHVRSGKPQLEKKTVASFACLYFSNQKWKNSKFLFPITWKENIYWKFFKLFWQFLLRFSFKDGSIHYFMQMRPGRWILNKSRQQWRVTGVTGYVSALTLLWTFHSYWCLIRSNQNKVYLHFSFHT